MDPFTPMDQDPPPLDDDDPVVATYPVYLNPTLPSNRKLIILQQPNRLATGTAAPTPTAMRIKPASGMVEVDVPIQMHVPSYDRDKGMRWGRALHMATTARAGGALGLPGGFGVGSTAAVGRRKQPEDGVGDDATLDWNEAVRHDRVLRTQTLGGQIPDSGEVQYMVGVFQGNDLHLTPASSLVHLRPQLHHIDSLAQQQDRPGPTSAAPAKPDATAAAAAAQQARAIHMTIKSADDGAAVTETMTDRLRAVQREPWRKLRYVDENDEAAWEVYAESLFLPGQRPVAPSESDDSAIAGVANTTTLQSTWTEDKYLRSISAMKNGRPGQTRKEAVVVNTAATTEDASVRRVKFEDGETGGSARNAMILN